MFTQYLVGGLLLIASAAWAQSPETASPPSAPAPTALPPPATDGKSPASAEPQQAMPAPPIPERGSEQSPVAVRIVPPVPPAAASDNSAQEWWQQSTWWLVIPTWLLALVSIGLAITTARLWRSTGALLRQGAETARNELRAYVALDEVFFNAGDRPETNTQKVAIRNYGQTPAHNVIVWCERASHLPEPTTPLYEPPLVGEQMLHPVQTFSRQLAASPLFGFHRPGFFTYGRISYRDVYERWWVTQFCYLYEGDGSFSPQDGRNREDGPFTKPPF